MGFFMAPWKRTLYAVWAAQLLAMSGFWMVMPFLAERIRVLDGVSVGKAAELMGWASFTAGICMACFSPIWGVLSDRYGRKAMSLRAMLGGALVVTLMGIAPNATSIIICRALQGALTGSIAASVGLVASVTPARHAGYALGMVHGAVYSGVFIGPLLGGVVCDRFSFQTSCTFAAVLLILAALFMLLGAQENFIPIPARHRKTRGSYKTLLGIGSFRAALLVLFFINLGACAVIPVFQFFVKELAGNIQSSGQFSQKIYALAQFLVQADSNGLVAPGKVLNTLTGVIFGCTGIASAIGAIILGRFSDKVGHRRILIICAVISAIITVPHIFIFSIGQLFLLRLVYGFIAAGMVPSANALIRRSVKQEQVGKAFGLSSSIGALGWAFGPLIGGYLATNSLRTPFWLTAAMFAVLSIYAFIFLRSRRSAQPGS